MAPGISLNFITSFPLIQIALSLDPSFIGNVLYIVQFINMYFSNSIMGSVYTHRDNRHGTQTRSPEGEYCILVHNSFVRRGNRRNLV